VSCPFEAHILASTRFFIMQASFLFCMHHPMIKKSLLLHSFTSVLSQKINIRTQKYQKRSSTHRQLLSTTRPSVPYDLGWENWYGTLNTVKLDKVVLSLVK
jgi:hypothetical protein